MSDSVRPHRLQPTRLHHPWDSPGKNTGVGCHFLLQCMKVKSESEVAQSCPTLSNPMGCSLPGSSVHGIFQARVLQWGAIAFSVEYLYSLNPAAAVLCEHQVDLFAHVSLNRRFKGEPPTPISPCMAPSSATSCPVDSTFSVALNSDLCFLKSVGPLCSGQIPVLHATVRILSPGRVLDDYGTQSSSFSIPVNSCLSGIT